jgi:hypothetical protein
VTPSLNIPNNGYVVKFWMYRDDDWLTNTDCLNIFYNTAMNLTGATLLGTVNRSINLSPVETSTGWYSYQFNLPMGSMGSGRYILFEGVSNWGNNIFMDDVYIGGPPCPNPGNFHVVSVAGTTATLAWTSTVSQWKIQYGPSGFALGTGTKVLTSSNPCAITGIADGCYDAWLQAVCSVTDTSDWIGKISFCVCNNVITPDYMEGFEGNIFPPVCWSQTIFDSTDSYYTWHVESFPPYYEMNNYVAVTPDIMSAFQNEWLYSPRFDISGTPNAQLKFAWKGNKQNSLPPNDNCDLNILISINNGTFTKIWNESNTDTSTWLTDDWRVDSISLLPYITNNNIRFAFQYVGQNGSSFALDAVKVEQLPPFFDLTVHQKDVSICDTLGWYAPHIKFVNKGIEILPTGSLVTGSYKVDLGSWVNQVFTLTSNLNPGDSVNFTFSTPYHFNQFITYNCYYAVHYIGDIVPTNDTVFFYRTYGSISVNIGNDFIICDNQSASLNAGTGFDTYNWSTGAATPSISFDSSGFGEGSHWFWVEVTSGSCNAVDSVQVTFDGCLGISEKETSLFNIYPNPSGGLFNLEISGMTGRINLLVYDLQGQEVYNEEFTGNSDVMNKQLDLAILSKGIYFAWIKNDSGQLIRKLVIE